MGEKEKKRFLEGGRDGWMEGVRGAIHYLHAVQNCNQEVDITNPTWLLPSDRNMCPRRTNEHDVSRFKSSAFAILRVSLR